MKDYSATITITVSFRARNEEQAQERADAIAELFNPPGCKMPKFEFDTQETQTEIEEES